MGLCQPHNDSVKVNQPYCFSELACGRHYKKVFRAIEGIASSRSLRCEGSQTCSVAERAVAGADLTEGPKGCAVVSVDEAVELLAAELGDVAPDPAHPQVVALAPDHCKKSLILNFGSKFWVGGFLV